MTPMLFFTATSFANTAVKFMIFSLKSLFQPCRKDLSCKKKMYITAAFAQAVTIKNNYYFEGVIYYEQKVLLPGMRLHK